MTTRFCGHKTGFNRTGENTTTPNEMGPPDTKFTGRGAVPPGQLKRYPGATADISGGNRRMARAKHGDGAGSGTTFSTHSAFGGPANTGKPSKAYDTKGGKGSGTNRK